MSYQVLARKWRPKSFATLVGQEHVVRALSHALDSGRLHHAWLFTGTRGVGKTTISRILAKALNCERGVSATPCDACEACLAIDGDRFPDYVEMDAASNRGVDDMAALLEQAVYAPVQGRYKVFMIDEVHMLTGHAFNAMLKTLEEPPAHLKFILATTDPQKIPVTVLSRCLQFSLKQMSPAHIQQHLSQVLSAEGVAFEPEALAHVARAAAGSMRDALSLLDQAIAHGAGRLEEAQVAAMLGIVGEDHLHGLLDALAAGEVERLVRIADDMEAASLSFEAALQGLARLLQRIALAQYAPAALADDDEASRARVLAHGERFDAEFLQLAYQIVIHGRDELALAPDEYTGFTMTLLRLHAFSPEQPAALGSGGGGGGSAAPGAVTAPAPATASAPAAAPPAAAPPPAAVAPAVAAAEVQRPAAESRGASQTAPAAPPAAPPATAPVAQPAAVHPVAAGSDVPPWENLPPEAYGDEGGTAEPQAEAVAVKINGREAVPASRPPVAAPAPPAPPAAAAVPSPVSKSEFAAAPPAGASSDPAPAAALATAAPSAAALLEAGDWAGLLRLAALGGMLRELAQHCAWGGLEGDVLQLQLGPAHAHLLKLDEGLLARLQETLASLTGRSGLRLRIEEAEPGAETPAQLAAAERRARHAEAVAALENDPFVRELVTHLDASLLVDSVRPATDAAP